MIKFNFTLLFLAFLVQSSIQVSIEKIPDGSIKSEDVPEPTNVTTLPLPGPWIPDLENEIWKEFGFPVEPEDIDGSSVESTTVTAVDPDFDFNDLNLTLIENRVAGGRINCQCGRPVAKVVEGEKARINDIPWTVALVRKGGFNIFGGAPRPFCGGTLINDRYIVTASHCVDGQTEKGIQVLVNEQDILISTETAGGTRKFDVDKIIKHPNYSRRTVDNDIALVRLAGRIDLTAGSGPTVPVCLPANNDNDFSGLSATVAGWGTTKEGGSTSNSLQKVDVPIIKNSECNSAATRYQGKITDSMLCAGFIQTGGKDACQGDSGGPLIIDNGTRKTLVGVVSWGFGCAQKRAPGVYARVARFPDWILANTRDAEWCSE
jgi:hypothetical protein